MQTLQISPFFASALLAVVGLIVNWRIEIWRHHRRLRTKKLRIHVNGIRGKSTVTRLVAGVLREAGYITAAKTTGSAACFIDADGRDHAIQRNGSPTILEQVEFIRRIDPRVEAIVVECMAIRPEYQRVCENHIVQSNIGIITNIREDHQDVLGETLEEIACHLLSTCPQNGVLITAEQNPQLLHLFRIVAAQRNTRLIVADPALVTDSMLSRFPYVAFKENVAIGIELASLLNIDPNRALHGMLEAPPDPGVLHVAHQAIDGTHLTWADLFAVNDRESVIAAMKRVAHFAPDRAVAIGLLNNRHDREHRAIQFARIAAQDLELDYVGVMGAYENRVATELVRNGFDPDRIIRLGAHRHLTGVNLLKVILRRAKSKHVLLAGLVNIHTDQAESLRELFDEKAFGEISCEPH